MTRRAYRSAALLRALLPALALLLCAGSALAAPAPDEELTEVVTTSPAWDTFTNEDGTGLYHEVLRAVFAREGISVRHWYAPSIRAKELVREGKADMMTCTDQQQEGTVLARWPLYRGAYYAFYDAHRIGPWQGDESLRGKVVTARASYYKPENFSVPVMLREVHTGEAGLGMVLLGRADFYVDDKSLIEQSIRESDMEFDRDHYEIRPVGRRDYRPLLPDTERGRRIRRIYEEGMDALYRDGTLDAIYQRWGFVVPVPPSRP